MGRSSEDELNIMRCATAESMEQGTFGVSYALIYPPNSYTDAEDLIEVCKVVSR